MALFSFGTTWRDNLSDASFRGVPFKVLKSETTIGRRIRSNVQVTQNLSTTNHAVRTQGSYFSGGSATYEDSLMVRRRSRVAGRVQVEQLAHLVLDLGREPERFQIEGYVIQNADNNFDYFKERDALMVALNTYGPGILTHPFYGELEVFLAEPAEVSESFNEGGIARFKMTFVESGRLNLENILPEYMYRIDSLSELLSDYGLDTLSSVLEAVENAAALAEAVVEGLEMMVQAVNSIKGAITSAIAAATGALSNLISIVDTLLDAPCEILRLLREGARSFENIVGVGGEVVSGGIVGGCSGIKQSNNDVVTLDGTSVPEDMGISVATSAGETTDYDSDDFGGNTASEDGVVINTVVSNTVKFFIFTVIIKIAIRIDFTNKDAMIDFIEKMVDFMDNFLDELGRQPQNVRNDDIFVYMTMLRNEFVTSMYGRGANLTKLTTYVVPPDGPPVIVIAYNLYEDIYMEQTILDLNPIIVTHPGFPPPGSILQVLEYE